MPTHASRRTTTRPRTTLGGTTAPVTPARAAARTTVVRPAVARAATALAAVLASALLLLTVGGAAPAAAHTALVSSDPAEGATVATAPAQVTLTFTEAALALGTVVEVRGPDERVVSAGEPVLTGTSVSQALAGELPAGRYTALWRATSADGHPIEGTLTFTAEGPTTAGAPGAAPGDATGGPTDAATATPEPTTTPTEPAGPSPTPTAPPVPEEREVVGADGPSTVGVLAVSGAAVLALLLVVGMPLRRRRAQHRTQDGGAAG